MLVLPELPPPGPQTTEGHILALFHLLDKDKSGSVPVSDLIHVLAGVASPTRLSLAEVRVMSACLHISGRQSSFSVWLCIEQGKIETQFRPKTTRRLAGIS